MDKENLIRKWLNGELTNDEKTAFDKLDDAQLNRYIIDKAQHFKPTHLYKTNDFNAFKTAYIASKKSIKTVNWYKPLLKIASVIIIALGVYFSFFFNNNNFVETLASQKTTVELPDNSKVELNALSSIKYSTRDWDNKRAVELKGEAYFKVAKGQTFNVITSDGVVTVVGTQFNVKQRSDYFEVKCFEGVVKVFSDTIISQLLAGDTFQILEGKFTTGKTLSESPKWIHNMSDFYAIPFKEVLSEIERQYNVEVTFKNIDVNRLFTGVFTHESLENALIAITQPMNMTYELSSSNLVIIHGKNN
ncbi:FecR family protein [Sabulilitoribacter multivorans]|uniref:FecR family protein n=1 Tax=Flaviramulus multivorans TaxID=1304750 RepID=A0ABS9ILC0_9FLAO|nr:FecR family protein [Flaviramulus multivorans]MCF7561385.1 FecR family protein [Flaviramulus multivorans]